MKTNTLTCLIALLALSISAAAQRVYDPEAEMHRELKSITEQLEPDREQVFQIANILNDRKRFKEQVFEQIAALYYQLEQYDHSADKQIKKLLSAEQLEVWNASLNLKLWNERRLQVEGNLESK